MTIETTYAPAVSAGNGTTTAFAVPWPFAAAADLDVQLLSATTGLPLSPAPVLNGAGTYDYTVAGAADPDTGIYPNGTVTFNTAPSAAYNVWRGRATADAQDKLLPSNGRFPAKAVEGALDRRTLVSQEETFGVSQALRVPATDSAIAVLPAASARATHVLGFAVDGSVALTVSTIAQIDAAVQSFVAFLATGANAAVLHAAPFSPASAPSITPSGDLTTGIFFSAAGCVGIALNGVQAYVANVWGHSFGTTVPSHTDQFFTVQVDQNGNTSVIVRNSGAGASSQAVIHVFSDGAAGGSDIRIATYALAAGAYANISFNSNSSANIIQFSAVPIYVWNTHSGASVYISWFTQADGSLVINNYSGVSTEGKAGTTQVIVKNVLANALAAAVINVVADAANFAVTVYSAEATGGNSSVVQVRVTANSNWNFIQASAASTNFYNQATLAICINASANVGLQTSAPTALLDVNSNVIRLRTAKTPASANDDGNTGDQCWDASYEYRCTATNTWTRVAHATW